MEGGGAPDPGARFPTGISSNSHYGQSKSRGGEQIRWVCEPQGDKRANGGCVSCDEDDPACLDFHHTDTDRKEMTVSSMISYGYSKERLLGEIGKCEILCANCHRKRHHTIPDRPRREVSNKDK